LNERERRDPGLPTINVLEHGGKRAGVRQGRELHPLSHVQAMRKTRQTSEFIAEMGPFFVGHVLRRV